APVEKKPEAPVEKKPEVPPAAEVQAEEDEEQEKVQEEDLQTPKQEKHLAPFGSTLVPKLTLTPSKPKSESSTPSNPPRSTDWASEATQALASVQGKKLEDLIKEDDTSASEAATLKRLEELEMKQALELSLTQAHVPEERNDAGELQLTAEELRFIMGDVVPKRSTKVIKKRTRAPETTDGSSPATVTRGSRRVKKTEGTSSKITVDTDKASGSTTHTDTESEQDVETPKPRVRGPQVIDPAAGNRLSQQGPRPWIPENEGDDDDDNDDGEDDVSETSETSTVDLHGSEEIASTSHVAETMGEEPVTKVPPKNTKNLKNTRTSQIHESMGSEPERPLESMGSEPERPLESMGSEPERPLESMGPEPERLLESMGDDGPDNDNNNNNNTNNNNNNNASIAFVPMPQMPSLDDIRQQKIMMKQQQQLQHQQQQMAAF
ncbi:hypothetical protein BGZ65_011568, partial [Modicella reniformis]